MNNRVSLSADYYNAHTRNVLYGLTLPISSGVTGQYVSNIGEMSNKGFEFSVTTINISSNTGFNWSTEFNIFWNRNQLVRLYNGFKQDIANQLFTGQPLSAIYDY